MPAALERLGMVRRPWIVACLSGFAVLLALGLASLFDGVPAWLADKDFANYWVGASLAVSGDAAYLFGSQTAYFQHLTGHFGSDYPWRNWSYPPHYLLFTWPLGLMSYVPAMFVFLAVTLVAYIVAAAAFLGRSADSTGKIAMAAVILVPFAMANIWTAQNGFLTGALILGGLALRGHRPVLAGILFGCLTIKPQLGVLLPLLLLVEGRWIAIASAAATAVVLILASAIAFGWQSWVGYVLIVMPYQSDVMNLGSGLFLSMMPGVFGSLRSLGVDSSTALLVHGAVVVCLLAVAAPVLLRQGEDRARAAILVMATMAVTPYWLVYDFGAAAAVLAWLWLRVSYTGERRRQDDASRNAGAILLAAACVPMVSVPLGLAGLPVAPLLLIAAFAVTLVQAQPAGAPTGTAGRSARRQTTSGA